MSQKPTLEIHFNPDDYEYEEIGPFSSQDDCFIEIYGYMSPKSKVLGSYIGMKTFVPIEKLFEVSNDSRYCRFVLYWE